MDDWLDRAACLNLSTLFHSTDDEPQRVRLTRERRALAVCGSCEVLTECRQAIDAAPALVDSLSMREVDRAVGNVRNNGPELIEPVS